MINVSEYDPDTGRIGMRHGFPDEECFELNRNPLMGYLEGDFDGAEYYSVDGQATARPASPVTLSDLTLQGVPEGSTLWINGESYDAEGDVELEFPLPGTYRLRVECWPYKDWEGEVTTPVVSGVEP